MNQTVRQGCERLDQDMRVRGLNGVMGELTLGSIGVYG